MLFSKLSQTLIVFTQSSRLSSRFEASENALSATFSNFFHSKFFRPSFYCEFGLSDWKFHSILTMRIARSPTRCSRQWSVNAANWKSTKDRKIFLRKSTGKLRIFPSLSSENPRLLFKIFSFTLKFSQQLAKPQLSSGKRTNTSFKFSHFSQRSRLCW